MKKKLSRGSQITHLDINVRFYFEDPDFIQLLRLAFIPSMESLSGLSESYDLFDNLYALSNSSLAKFEKLKVIPSLKRSFHKSYGNALLAFKETLEGVRLTFYDFSIGTS